MLGHVEPGFLAYKHRAIVSGVDQTHKQLKSGISQHDSEYNLYVYLVRYKVVGT